MKGLLMAKALTSAHHVRTGSHGSSCRGPGAQLSCSLASSCSAVPLGQRSLARCAVTQLHAAVETKHVDLDFWKDPSLSTVAPVSTLKKTKPSDDLAARTWQP